jgi:hypothetical protein
MLGSRTSSPIAFTQSCTDAIGCAQFSALQGVTLSPLFFLNPAILSRAGIYTAGALGKYTQRSLARVTIAISMLTTFFRRWPLLRRSDSRV